MEEVENIWTSISQVENDTNNILIGLEIISDIAHKIDVDDDDDFDVSKEQIKEMLDNCDGISDLVSLLDDSVDELKETIEKLKNLKVYLALNKEEEE